MNLRHLEYLIAVVDHDGFTRAAEHLYVSQSAISQAIGALEREIGVELFHRTHRSAVLTEAGRAILPEAREIVRAMGDVGETVSAIQGGLVGTVRVMTQDSPGLLLLHRVLPSFAASFPGIRTVVTTALNADAAVAAVRDAKQDIGLVSTHESPAAGELTALRVGYLGFEVISPPADPLGTDPVEADRLSGVPLVVGQVGTFMRAIVDRLDLPEPPRIVCEVEGRGHLVALVLAGVGHAVVPAPWAEVAQRLGAHRARLVPQVAEPIWLIFQAGRRTRSARGLIEHFATIAGHHQPL